MFFNLIFKTDLLPLCYKHNIMAKQAMKISEYNYNKLKEMEGATWNNKVMTLFSIVEPYMPYIEYSETNKSIKVEQSTKELVDSFRITLGESRDNIITRAFLILDELNNASANDYWITFKIVNPYNNSLVISGQLEYNSKEISFNYGGNVFRGKLPPIYIANGEDLTKELYLWQDVLDWNRITDLILKNHNGSFEEKTTNYILTVNDI